jgi:Rps23 Pro-64 3,4-dihydroxylase Tpa1-like proline 4-hydroxylase
MKLTMARIGIIYVALNLRVATRADFVSDAFETLDIKKLLDPKLLKHPAIVESISENLMDGKVMVLRNAFHPDVADAVYRELNTASEFVVDQDHHERGSHHFFRSLNVDAMRHHKILNATLEVFSSEATKQFMSNLSGRDCMGEMTEARVELYQLGDHSLPTPDFLNQRTVGFEWHLAKDWKPEWGGALYWCQESAGSAFLHASFNTLILYNVNQDFSHFVTPITTETTSKRLSITGWWNSAWNPQINDDYEQILEAWQTNMTQHQYLTTEMIIKSEAFRQDRRNKVDHLLTKMLNSRLRPNEGIYRFGEDKGPLEVGNDLTHNGEEL